MTTTPEPAKTDRNALLREGGQYVFVTPRMPALAEVFHTARHQPLVRCATCAIEVIGPDEDGPATLLNRRPRQPHLRELEWRGCRVGLTR